MKTNRDLLAEAIADAKTVKETAIANAKLALEESFTPYLKEKLAAKLTELDESDEIELKEEEVKENETEEKVKENMELDVNEVTEETEELDLEALLKELEGSIEEETINGTDSDAKPGDHGNEVNLNEEKDKEDKKDEDKSDESKDKKDEEDEEINIEDMTTEDLESFIKDVIEDMVAAGELEAGESETNNDELESTENSEEEVDMDALVNEIKAKANAKKDKDKDEEKEKLKKDLKEAYETIKLVKKELNEVNLFNAKLLYTNKIFRNKNLNENQKIKVLAAFDKASSIKEAKLVYETLSEGIKTTKPKINESLLKGSASKSLGVNNKKPILEVDNQVNRWQVLAGIKPKNN